MNTKEELLAHIAGRKVIAMRVSKQIYRDPDIIVSYSEGDDWAATLYRLDFDYDNGYGGQELYGTIWYSDGTWSDRGKYDGSEWWEHYSCPEIPPKAEGAKK